MREPFRAARLILNSLLLAEVILGFMIIAITSYAQCALRTFLASSERKGLTSQFFNGYILGGQLIVTYLCSLGMWHRLWQRRCTNTVKLLLNIWMFFCFLIVLCGFGSIWTLLNSGEGLEHTVEGALRKGIDMYYACPEWKLLWDSLQYYRQCCGVYSYKDWMKAKWMPPEDSGSNADCVPAPKKETVLAPYACCKHNCSSCYQNYVPGATTSSTKIPDLNLNQINACGCMPQFSIFLWKTLYWLLGLIVIAFKLDLLICAITKLIIRKQSGDDVCNEATDDEGRPLVVVKCPSNIRCVTFDEDESSDLHCGSTLLNKQSSTCTCCGRLGSSSHEKFKVRQERVKAKQCRIVH